MQQTNSLRRELLNWLIWPFVITLLISTVAAYLFSLRAAMDAYDLSLMDDALDLAKQVEAEHNKFSIELPLVAKQMLQSSNNDHVTYAAWNEDGQVFAGNHKLYDANALTSTGRNHKFRDIVINGEKNREVILRGKSEGQTFYIAVAQTIHGRERLSESLLAGILLPEALLAIVAIIAAIFGIQRGLKPVQQLRDEIISRSPTDLRPIDVSSTPSELAPIVHGINELLAKLATSFASHRRFIADASHQIRTPLAALSTQIEVGLERPPQQIEPLLQQLLGTTQRTTHLANQLLSLAKLEHTEQNKLTLKPTELKQVFMDAITDIITLSDQKHIELNFDLHPCQINGNAMMLHELINNLLDNAVRYTPEGGIVNVQLLDQQITISDNGPGIPAEELEKLGTPFHRLSTSNPNGCGLGLAIAREIAQLHGASITFTTAEWGHGLCVRVRFAGQANI